jgi:trimeric autotransporter adhesin
VNMLSHRFTTWVMVLSMLLLGAPAVSNAQYAINLVAGGGPNGLSALSSSVGYPGGVARDGLGNTYVADSYSSRIFKVDSAGMLTVFAGNGSGIGGEGGYSGDGGPATSAELGRPESVAVDASGNVFIADTDNSVIRCVVGVTGGCFGSTLAVGSITTVAGVFYESSNMCIYSGDGGPAISAQLCRPSGVFVDANSNIFIADTENSVIRCVVGVTGGCFGSTLAVGSITTVAGNVTSGAGYSGDGGAAVAAQLNLPNGVFVDGSGNIFIADTFNSVIREVAVATGKIQTVAGAYYPYNFTCNYSGDSGVATSAQLCLPSGVSVDGSSNIFIADTDNSVIRCVVGSAGGCSGSTFAVGYITTLAGTGTQGYTGDGGPAASAELDYPNGLYVDASDNVFIADTDNFVIREVSSSTIQTFVGNHTVAYSGDGHAGTGAALYASAGVFVDGSHNIFVADTYNCAIREVLAATGDIQTVAGKGTCGYSGNGAAAISAELNYPSGVFVDSLGDIFIADTENSVIREVVAATGYIQTVAGSGTAGYSGDGGAATSAQLSSPSSVFLDSGGNIFIADTDNSAIRCVVGTAGGCFGSTLAIGNITTVAGTGTPCPEPATSCGDGGVAASAQLNFPAGVSVDVFGNLFIADTFDSKIREVVAATSYIQTVAGNGTAGYSGDGGPATSGVLYDPYGVSVDSLGNIFIADTSNSVVREVVAVSGNIQTIAGNGTEGYTGDGGPGTSAELAHPLGVAADASGNVFVADTENSRIRELSSTVSVTSIPSSATLPTGGSQQFAATVTGATDTSVTWQVNGVTGGNSTVGTISALGSYQAPAAVPSPATVTVTAVANANGVNAAPAPVTIVSGSGTLTVTVSTSPTVTEVYTSATQTFVANVTDTTNTAVNWQVNGVLGGNSTVGTISTAGVYSAPAAVPTPPTVVIGAVSQADSTVSGSYPIMIVTAPTAPQPPPQTVSAGGTVMYSISLNQNTGNPKQPITLSCLKSSLPPNATCTFSPSTIVPGPSAVPFTLTINVPTNSASVGKPNRMWLAPQLFAAFIPLAALLFFGLEKRKKCRQWLPFLVLLFASLILLIGCGGGSSSSSPPQSVVYSVQVQGTTPAQPNPTTITTVSLTVQ